MKFNMKETEHTITDTETDTHSSRRFRPKRTIAAAVFVVVVMCLMGAFYRDPSTFAPSSYLNRGSTDIAAVVEAEANSTSPVPISFTKLPETSPGPKGREIVLLMASDNGQQGNPIPYHHERAYENRKEFADWHGYTLENYNFDDFSVEEGVHVIWKKILAIKRAFDNNPDAEWVFWLDLDVILMTSHIPLSTYLLAPSVLQSHLLLNTSIMGNSERVTPYDQSAKDVDLIMAQDHNGPNAGVMLLRRSEWTETLLDLWMDPLFIAQDFPRREQDVLFHLLEKHDHIFERIGFVSMRDINAYTHGGTDFGWNEGDLLVHFAGCWVSHECEQNWEKYWARRSPVPKKYLRVDRQFP